MNAVIAFSMFAAPAPEVPPPPSFSLLAPAYTSTCNCEDRNGACACQPSQCVCPGCLRPGANVATKVVPKTQPVEVRRVSPFPSTRTTPVIGAAPVNLSSRGFFRTGGTFTPAGGAEIRGFTSGCLSGG